MATVVQYILSLKDDLSGGVDKANRSVNTLESSLGKANNAARSLGAALGITFGVAGVALFTRSMINAGTEVENAKTGLTTLLKNAQEAQGVINNTMKDATATPFAFEGLLSANKALISAGVESSKAREDVLNLANAIAATGGGDAELQRMVVNLQQISNTGKATALDIKQFAFAGVNIYKVLEAAGIKANDKGKESAITYQQITEALKKAHEAGGIYYNGLENMAGNTSVQISNLGDAIFQLQVKMFNDLKPAIEWVISGLFKLIDVARKIWDQREAILSWGKAIAAGLIVFKAISLAMAAWPAILMAAEAATYALMQGNIALSGSFVAALNPIALIAVAVGGLVLLFEKLGDNITKAREERNKFLNASKEGEITMLETISGSYGGGQKGKDRAVEEEKAHLWEQLNDLKKSLTIAEAKGDEYRMKQLNDQRSEILQRMAVADQFQQGLIPGKAKTNATAGQKTLPEPKTKATGSKSVTINVSIKELIHEYSNNVTNMKEGASKIRDHVVAALTGAVNDFQVVAGA